MNFVDAVSVKVADFIIRKNQVCEVEKIESADLQPLRELKDELVAKQKEIDQGKVEWDRTFDAIIDNIVIVGVDRTITKVNDAFIECVRLEDGPYGSLIGMSWDDFREDMDLPTELCLVADCFETKTHQQATIDQGNKIYSVMVNPIFNDAGEVISAVRISRDVTKMECQKRKLERKSEVFQAISQMSKLLMDHDDWDTAIKTILELLGRSVGASRVYIFKNEIRNERVCALFDNIWKNEDRYCVAGNVAECVNYDLLPKWKTALSQGNPVHGNIVDCDICPEKNRCSCFGEFTICAVPIFADKDWWGFIGFDYQNNLRKKWKDDDEAVLTIAADIIGGVIHHRQRYFDCVDGCENIKSHS